MIERISISVDLSDQRLHEQLTDMINANSVLLLSEEDVPYPEEIIVSDRNDYIPKMGEIYIAVNNRNDLAFASTSKDIDEILKACHRARCYWETANMNRNSMNSLNTHRKTLEALAERLLTKTHEKDLPADICKSIVNEMPIAMLLVDSEGYVSMMNAQAQEFFQGYDVSPLSRLAEIVLPDEFNIFLEDEKCDRKELLIGGRILNLQKFDIPIVNKASAKVLLFN